MNICKWPDGCDNYCEGATDYCGTHGRLSRKLEEASKKEVKKPKPIPKRSQKMEIILEEYYRRLPGFLYKKKCAVYPELKAIEVHHSRGREGYADDYARENDIPLILDERWWLAVSRKGHKEIENNPDWAKEKGFSYNQTEKIL